MLVGLSFVSLALVGHGKDLCNSESCDAMSALQHKTLVDDRTAASKLEKGTEGGAESDALFQRSSSLSGAQSTELTISLKRSTESSVASKRSKKPAWTDKPFGGEKLSRQFGLFGSLPIGADALLEQGWIKHDAQGCDPVLGFAWTKDAQGLTKEEPLTLYTTSGGQPSGVGIVILGKGQAPLPEAQKKFATQKPLVAAVNTGEDEVAHIDISFRDSWMVCDGKRYPDAGEIGHKLTVNPKASSGDDQFSIPVMEDDAELEGWKRGSCFDTMGWHRLKDFNSNGLSGEASNLLPVAPIYFDGKLVTLMFISTVLQQDPIEAQPGTFMPNGWETQPLNDAGMCFNTCDSACTFNPERAGAKLWSTMHIFLADHMTVMCPQETQCKMTTPGGLRLGCCDP